MINGGYPTTGFMDGFLGGYDFVQRLRHVEDERESRRGSQDLLLKPGWNAAASTEARGEELARGLAGRTRSKADGQQPVGLSGRPAEPSVGMDAEPPHIVPDSPREDRLDILRSLVSGKGLPLGGGLDLAPPVAKPPAFRIIPRHAWAKYQPDQSNLKRYMGPYTGMILHHTGDEITPRQVEDLHTGRIPLYEMVARKALRRYYESGDVGYNYFIDRDGTIYEGRSLSYEPAHTFGHNPGNIGIAFLGDYTDQPLSDEAIKAGLELSRRLRDEHRMGVEGNDFISTHGQHSEEKKNELRGAMKQIEEMKRQLRKSKKK